MAGIRSINEPKAPLQPDVNVPKIATQAVGEPPKPTTTVFTAERIVGMIVFQDMLFVATENGVYVKRDTGLFVRCKFEIVEETTE